MAYAICTFAKKMKWLVLFALTLDRGNFVLDPNTQLKSRPYNHKS